MSEIEFSFIADNPSGSSIWPALAEFEAQHHIHVQAHGVTWDTAWAELAKIAMYRSGPDVSVVGSTWIDSFISMNTLRPFTPREVAEIGGPQVFLPAAWQSGLLGLQVMQTVWAIPRTSDTRLIFYRRDLLQRAGIDERTAFQSAKQLEQTLRHLQESGIAAPWAISTDSANFTLHTMASWVWGAGGHFISDDGKRTRFSEPEALAGTLAYFGLHRYMSPEMQNMSAARAGELFREGKVALVISGPWIMNLVLDQRSALPEVIDNLGVAPVPGIPFVGGEDLVIWAHTHHPREAVELVRFLTSREIQSTYFMPRHASLPARLEALEMPPFTTDPRYQTVVQSLKTGRSFRATYMWGLVEERIGAVLSELWRSILTDPGLDLAQVVTERLEELARRLDSILAG